jgi:hypothetical protein
MQLETFAGEAAIPKLGMKVDAAVRIRCSLDVHHQFELFEIVIVDRSLVERVRHGQQAGLFRIPRETVPPLTTFDPRLRSSTCVRQHANFGWC